MKDDHRPSTHREMPTVRVAMQPAPEARADAPPARPGLSLRAKAVGMFVAMAAFLAATLLSVSHHRERLLGLAEELETLHVVESNLARVNAAAAAAVLKINDDAAFAEPRDVANSVAIEIEGIGPGLRTLQGLVVGGAPMAARLEAQLARARATSSRADLLDLRAEVHHLVARLGQAAVEVRARKERLWEGYRTQYDEITRSLLATTVIGLTAFGAAALGAFRSLPLTFLGGIAIGIAAALATKWFTDGVLAGIPPAVPFLVLFIALLVLPRRFLADRSRAIPLVTSTWRAPLRLQAILAGAVLAVIEEDA